MKFQLAVQNTLEIKNSFQAGIQALENKDRSKVSFSNTKVIAGSINLDRSLYSTQPHAPRWDYGIGIKQSSSRDVAVWVEIHQAKSSEVKTIISKVIWLKDFLKNHAPDLQKITRTSEAFIWVATKEVSLSRTSNQARILSKEGVEFPREHWRF